MNARRSIALAILAASVACSSTASRDRSSPDDVDGAPRTVAIDQTESPPAPATASSARAARSRSGAPVGAGRQDPAGAVAGGAAARAVAAGHPAVTAKEIPVGFTYLSNLAALYAALGVNNPAQSDADIERAAEAVIESINARGGVAGRTLKLAIHPMDYNNGRFDEQAQSVCEDFTRDRPAFAVINGGNNHGTLLPSCLAKAKTPMIDIANSVHFDRASVRAFGGTFYRPTSLDLSRYRVLVDQLADQGFLKKENRVGLIRYDLPQMDRTSSSVIKPALASRGLKLAAEFEYQYLGTVPDIGRIAQQSSTAVLRFRQAQVDRVIVLASQGPMYLFPVVAENQGYRPRYALTTADLPQFWTQNVPSTQMRGATGIGWLRTTDLPPGRSYPKDDAWVRCTKIMKDAGLGPAFAGFCDPFNFLAGALGRSRVVSAAGLRTAVDGLGTSVASYAVPTTRWREGRFDAIGSVYRMDYDAGCNCFRYVGSPRRVP